MKCIFRIIAGISLVALCCMSSNAQSMQGSLKQGFENPPESARPRVWWHWMNGNVTQKGIALDLQWMKDVGLGGFTQLDIGLNTPQVVKKRLIYMSPGWKNAFRFAEATGHKYGFEMAIGSAPGWGETGGPWVSPAQAMKKMVWSEIRVEGGKRFSMILPMPPKVTGTFQDYGIDSGNAHGKHKPPLPRFYADTALVAYRLPSDDETQPQLHPEITSSGGTIDVPELSDGDVADTALRLPAAQPGKNAWVQFEYPKPQTIQSLTLATLDDMRSIFDFPDPNAEYPEIEASDNGKTFHYIAKIPPSSIPQRTIAFPAVTARFFRVIFPTPSNSTDRKPHDHLISELILYKAARVNEFEMRAGFAVARNYYAIATPPALPGSVVPKKDVINLTGMMKPNGSLTWTPPPGKWAILRIGYSLIGHENGPAPPEATGLEVDKLNRQDVHHYMEGYLKLYSDTLGASSLGKGGIGYLLTDSVEVGPQNWTNNILADFRRLRGYDPYPWLPALTGVIVQSPEDTTRFLWDFRRTIASLLAENHYGEIAEDLHHHGMGYYSEALEYHRPSLGDDMEMRRHADIPMGAMWTFPPNGSPTPTYIADLRGAASVSHIYGQNLVGAESMTSTGPAWGYAPDNLKMIADLEFALGVNQFEIHESAHQPLINKAPGMTLGPYGLWFNRNQTWAQEAGPWVQYLARCSYMLQQGHSVNDIAYFYGQEGPITAVFGWRPQQDVPQGYGFDFVNSDVILHQLTFRNGHLVTPGGARYRVLYLGGESSKMTLPVLRRLRDLVSEGAVVAGNKPIGSPSLADNEEEFYQIADQLWGSESVSGASIHSYGKGKVYAGQSLGEVLSDLHVAKDFAYTQPEADTRIMFVHRHLADGDIYFVDNRVDHPERLEAAFRVQGKAPDFWYPDTGKIEPASYHIANGLTTVPLQLDPYGTVFIVFRKPATLASRNIPPTVSTILSTLHGPWSVNFQRDRGAPVNIKLERLASWTANSNPGVRHFSGSATYIKTIHAPKSWFKPGVHLWLNLGAVKELASVTVNGQPIGIVWKSPYSLDVTNALKPGKNKLAIAVTNLWVNRLIGDQQPGVSKKYTFTDITPYKATSSLLPSGLLGPVSIISKSTSGSRHCY